jgi:hypothetical protein
LGEHEQPVWPDPDGWRRLLSDFSEIRNALQGHELERWRHLLTDFSQVRDALQAAVGEPSASRCTFNVFEVTWRRAFEVTTHSALLCDLLDPRGSHGQGGVFLKAFLKIVDVNLPAGASRPPWPPTDGWWSVAPEFPAEHGRLDIILSNRGPSGPATIVIENKWDHGLGHRQLERYGEYLAKLGRSGQPHRTCLVYLTRSGEKPSMKLPVEFVCLSHSTDIYGLIESTLAALTHTAPAALREPLLQYLAILGDDDD